MKLKLLTTLALSAVLGTHAQAGSLFFNDTTDSVTLDFNSVIGTTMTIEAVFAVTGTSGLLFNEHQSFAEDKQFGVGSAPNSNYGFAFPNGGGNLLLAPDPISANAWHHIAYVLDGSQERLFIDGLLVGIRAASSDIGDGGNSTAALGANSRDGSLRSSFVGYLDSFRVSAAALYTSNFSAPSGDLAPGSNDLILLNFNEGSGNTVTDFSANQLRGTFGGNNGATLPEWQVSDPFAPPTSGVPEPSTLALAGLALAAIAWKRRR
jgi:hypothetical protein